MIVIISIYLCIHPPKGYGNHIVCVFVSVHNSKTRHGTGVIFTDNMASTCGSDLFKDDPGQASRALLGHF